MDLTKVRLLVTPVWYKGVKCCFNHLSVIEDLQTRDPIWSASLIDFVSADKGNYTPEDAYKTQVYTGVTEWEYLEEECTFSNTAEYMETLGETDG